MNLDQSRSDDEQLLLKQFVQENEDYYGRTFDQINSSSSWLAPFNLMAFLLGSIWFFARGVWHWAVVFVLIETFAMIQIARGLFGELGAEAMQRIQQIEITLQMRYQQLEAAKERNPDNIGKIEGWISSLKQSILDNQADAASEQSLALWIVALGLGILLIIRVVQGFLANSILERRFHRWLSERGIAHGLSTSRTLVGIAFVVLVYVCASIHYARPGMLGWLAEFPTHPDIRLGAIALVEQFFDFVITAGQDVFNSITIGIRWVLDALEVIFVFTPWPVTASFIILLTYLSAGLAASIFAAGFLAYMGFLGFWDKAMTTLALLGTAACISIMIGIPLGLFCARRPNFYAFIRPIMDFMQTMPAFVFMIPVIAFFGTGKPAAVVTTMIFGGTPVVRLTVLGMRGVPDSVREAAVAFGASPWYLLTKIDLPLASPSILAGVNQTIMLSLAMVVVASLIGAKGLGEDVLEALQYASVGQGILAGFAILFCAMILDRVVQGKRKS